MVVPKRLREPGENQNWISLARRKGGGSGEGEKENDEREPAVGMTRGEERNRTRGGSREKVLLENVTAEDKQVPKKSLLPRTPCITQKEHTSAGGGKGAKSSQ